MLRSFVVTMCLPGSCLAYSESSHAGLSLVCGKDSAPGGIIVRRLSDQKQSGGFDCSCSTNRDSSSHLLVTFPCRCCLANQSEGDCRQTTVERRWASEISRFTSMYPNGPAETTLDSESVLLLVRLNAPLVLEGVSVFQLNEDRWLKALRHWESSDDCGAAARVLEADGVGRMRSVVEVLTAWKEGILSCKPYAVLIWPPPDPVIVGATAAELTESVHMFACCARLRVLFKCQELMLFMGSVFGSM
jgi:hypothetical protein